MVVDPEFLTCMNDLLKLGEKKHKEQSFQFLINNGVTKRTPRLKYNAIMQHAISHLQQYDSGIEHNYFEDWEHQLAAVAVNAMMEFMLRKRGFQ